MTYRADVLILGGFFERPIFNQGNSKPFWGLSEIHKLCQECPKSAAVVGVGIGVVMKRVCAWCQKDLDPLGFEKQSDARAPITHGICGNCIRENLFFKAKPLRSFLEQFPEPVFLITEDDRIVAGNSAGLKLLGKKHSQVTGELGGDAFDCKYARQPGGCGNTLHCKSCTIRNTVMETMRSGRSNIRIPAYPDLHHMTGEKRLCFLITTEKVNESVLLRIDSVSEEDIS